MKKITFIGCGNMSSAIIRGMLQAGFAPERISATARSDESLAAISAMGIEALSDNQTACDQADVVVVGVKPQMVGEVFGEIQLKDQMLISLCAGLPIAYFERLCGARSVVRSMPNTPVLVGKGATGLFANAQTSEAEKQLASEIFSAGGLAQWTESEAQIDAVTAASGSGVAYMFAMIEHMMSGAEKLGMDPESAKALIAQTMAGAAEMALTSADSPGRLREKVTSKGGTTAEALKTFDALGFESMVHQAMQAAYRRAGELAKLD